MPFPRIHRPRMSGLRHATSPSPALAPSPQRGIQVQPFFARLPPLPHGLRMDGMVRSGPETPPAPYLLPPPLRLIHLSHPDHAMVDRKKPATCLLTVFFLRYLFAPTPPSLPYLEASTPFPPPAKEIILSLHPEDKEKKTGKQTNRPPGPRPAAPPSGHRQQQINKTR